MTACPSAGAGAPSRGGIKRHRLFYRSIIIYNNQTLHYNLSVLSKLLTALLVLSLFCCINTFAKDTEWSNTPHFSHQGFDFKAEGGFAVNTGESWEKYRFAFQPYFQMDSDKSTLYAGFQFGEGTIDAMGGMTLWPWVWNRMRVGVGTRYSFNRYDNISLTHNMIVSGEIEARPFKRFGVKFLYGNMLKSRRIFAIDDAQRYIHNFTFVFSTQTDFYLPYDMKVSLIMASYERYRYMLAVAPSFTLALSKRWANGLSVTFEDTARYTDFFTASTYYDGSEFRLLIGWEF